MDQAVPTSLYRFYDADDQLLYVGITSVGWNRWTHHEAHRPWWVDVVRTHLTHYPSREEASIAERQAIKTEKPRYNVTHNKPERARKTRRIHGPRGQGSVYRRFDGRWGIAFDSNGRRVSTVFREEADARLILAALVGSACKLATRQRAIQILGAGPETMANAKIRVR